MSKNLNTCFFLYLLGIKNLPHTLMPLFYTTWLWLEWRNLLDQSPLMDCLFFSIISMVRNHMSRPHPSHANTHTLKFTVPSVQPTDFFFHLRPLHPWPLLHTRHDLFGITSTLFTPTHSRTWSLVPPSSLIRAHATLSGFYKFFFFLSICLYYSE